MAPTLLFTLHGSKLGCYVAPNCRASWGIKTTAGQPSVQFSSVQLLSRVRLCNPMNHGTPGLPVHHQLLEFPQTTLSVVKIGVRNSVTEEEEKEYWSSISSLCHYNDESEGASCSVMSGLPLCNPMDFSWNSPGQNTRVGSHSLLQGIFPAQGLYVDLLPWRQILYHWATKDTQF